MSTQRLDERIDATTSALALEARGYGMDDEATRALVADVLGRAARRRKDIANDVSYCRRVLRDDALKRGYDAVSTRLAQEEAPAFLQPEVAALLPPKPTRLSSTITSALREAADRVGGRVDGDVDGDDERSHELDGSSTTPWAYVTVLPDETRVAMKVGSRPGALADSELERRLRAARTVIGDDRFSVLNDDLGDPYRATARVTLVADNTDHRAAMAARILLDTSKPGRPEQRPPDRTWLGDQLVSLLPPGSSVDVEKSGPLDPQWGYVVTTPAVRIVITPPWHLPGDRAWLVSSSLRPDVALPCLDDDDVIALVGSILKEATA